MKTKWQNILRVVSIEARLLLSIVKWNYDCGTWTKLVCLGCLQVIFVDKWLNNAILSFGDRGEQNRHSRGIPSVNLFKQKLEAGVDLYEWAPSAHGPISSHHWHLPSEGLAFSNKHPICALFAKSCIDFQVYFKPLHYFSHLMLKTESK